MNFSIGRTKSSRGKCCVCEKKMKKDVVKLILKEKGWNWTTERNFCISCGRKRLDEEINDLMEIKRLLK